MRTIFPPNAHLVPENATRVFKGIIYDVYHWPQKMFDGSTATFEMLKRPDTIKTIAIKDNKIVIVDEEQPNHKPFYDIPGGRHDVESEDELECAKRELLEETGMTFKTWKLLDVTQRLLKIEQFVYVFLATDFESQTEQNLDTGEKIKIELRDLADVKKLATTPEARYLPTNILDQVNSLDELLALPEYKN
jgi:ADP-ribose pyrophosphatase